MVARTGEDRLKYRFSIDKGRLLMEDAEVAEVRRGGILWMRRS